MVYCLMVGSFLLLMIKTPGWTAEDWSNLPNGTPEEKAKASIERCVLRLTCEIDIFSYAFNAFLSARLPLDRSVPDSRSQECKAVSYPSRLPTASVIICFVDEMWSTLLRTVVSVLNRSPPSILKEVILVDDASPAAWLGEVLFYPMLLSSSCSGS